MVKYNNLGVEGETVGGRDGGGMEKGWGEGFEHFLLVEIGAIN